MEKLVYLNGILIPQDEAKISALDYGFLFGYGLFETMRAYDGKIFRLAGHLERLRISAGELGIAADIQSWSRAVDDTLRANGLKEARVRLTLSPGQGELAPDLRSCTRPTLLVAATEYRPYPQEVYDRGWKAIVSSIRRNSRSPVPGMKTANFLESLLARREARASGADDAVLLNDRGLVAEASSSNIFLVHGGTLKTPRRDSGILPGITRSVVLELAAQLNIPAQEGEVTPVELMESDEAFITNSMIEIMPLTAVSGKALASRKVGLITQRLIEAYKSLVQKETG